MIPCFSSSNLELKVKYANLNDLKRQGVDLGVGGVKRVNFSLFYPGGEGLGFVLHSAKISSAPSILIFCVHPCEKLCEVANY